MPRSAVRSAASSSGGSWPLGSAIASACRRAAGAHMAHWPPHIMCTAVEPTSASPGQQPTVFASTKRCITLVIHLDEASRHYSHRQTRFNRIRHSPNMPFTRRRSSSHDADRKPCTRAFCDVTAFPFSVLGPVDWLHGFQRLITSACLAHRSGVRPFTMLMLRSDSSRDEDCSEVLGLRWRILA